MLDVFSLIFVADTKIIFRYDFVAPLKLFLAMRLIISFSLPAQKLKFFIKHFFCKCDQICSFLWIWSQLLKKSLMETFIFCAVSDIQVAKQEYSNFVKASIFCYYEIFLKVFWVVQCVVYPELD